MGEDQPQNTPQKSPQTSVGSAGHEGCVASLAAGFLSQAALKSHLPSRPPPRRAWSWLWVASKTPHAQVSNGLGGGRQDPAFVLPVLWVTQRAACPTGPAPASLRRPGHLARTPHFIFSPISFHELGEVKKKKKMELTVTDT